MSVELIAELGSVHDGSFGNAQRLIEAASLAGADAVKLQLHVGEAESRPDAPSPSFFLEEPRIDYFNRIAFRPQQWRRLKELANSLKMRFVCSPFSLEAVDILNDIGVDVYKIASGEVTNLPLIEKVAELREPVLLSSGMSSWSELDRAMDTLRDCEHTTVLQCSSIYPCPAEEVGLNLIPEIVRRYNCDVGLSDHTLGTAAALGAVALGARAIEKHFTLSRMMYGSDAPQSMEPSEFTHLAREIRELSTMLECSIDKNDIGKYQEIRLVFQKSIVAAVDIPEGTVLRFEHLAFKKPGEGLSPAEYRKLLGRRTRQRIEADTPISEKVVL